MRDAAREWGDELDELAPGLDLLASLRSQIHQVHRLLEERVSVAAERTRTRSAAHAEVLSLYVHALCVEDTTVNVLLRQKAPLFKGAWIGGHLLPWDLATLQGYAEVVYAATDAVLSRLTPIDLRSTIDLSAAGLGCPDVRWVLNRFVLFETAMICGEIAAGAGRRAQSGDSAAAEHAAYAEAARPQLATTGQLAAPQEDGSLATPRVNVGKKR